MAERSFLQSEDLHLYVVLFECESVTDFYKFRTEGRSLTRAL